MANSSLCKTKIRMIYIDSYYNYIHVTCVCMYIIVYIYIPLPFNPGIFLEGLGQKFLLNIPPDHMEYTPPRIFWASKRRGRGSSGCQTLSWISEIFLGGGGDPPLFLEYSSFYPPHPAPTHPLKGGGCIYIYIHTCTYSFTITVV